MQVLFSLGDILVAWLLMTILRQQHATEKQVSAALIAWLYNPFTFTISTRGSCDVLVVILLLWVLLCLHKGYATTAAVVYGFAVHFRVYPIIYAPSIVCFLASRSLARQSRKMVSACIALHQGMP